MDALWWCFATVTTVGYGDVVPVTSLGRAIAMVYMSFGIAMISILLSAITSNFMKRRIEGNEALRRIKETLYLRNILINKINDIEKNSLNVSKAWINYINC